MEQNDNVKTDRNVIVESTICGRFAIHEDNKNPEILINRKERRKLNSQKRKIQKKLLKAGLSVRK